MTKIAELENELEERTKQMATLKIELTATHEEQMRALAVSSQEERDLMQEQHDQIIANERTAHQKAIGDLKASEEAERERQLAEELGKLKTAHEE